MPVARPDAVEDMLIGTASMAGDGLGARCRLARLSLHLPGRGDRRLR